MQVFKDAGVRVPEDVAIVGFNSDTICKVASPKLTTINYQGFEMAQFAARTVICHLKGLCELNITSRMVIRSELIVRGSSLEKEKK